MRERPGLNRKSFRRINDRAKSSGIMVVADPLLARHEVEQHVWRQLHAASGVHFTSLIVRRMRDGFCLEGVMEIDDLDSAPDVCSLVRRVAGVQVVVNRIVARESGDAPNLPR